MSCIAVRLWLWEGIVSWLAPVLHGWLRLDASFGTHVVFPNRSFVWTRWLWWVRHRLCYLFNVNLEWSRKNVFYCALLLIFLLLGFYMYIGTTGRSYGDKAKLLFSPPSSVIGTMCCLKFYYHMYGSTINRLDVFNGHSIVFTRSGQQGNRWLYAAVTIPVENTVSYVCEIKNDMNQGMACLDTILLCP